MQGLLRRAAVACGCVSVCLAPAQAQVIAQARAVLQNISFTVYDALPGDGIAPSVSFVDATNAWRSLVNIYVAPSSDVAGYLGSQFEVMYAANQAVPAPVTLSTGIHAAQGLGAAGDAWSQDTGSLGAQGQALANDRYFSGFATLSSTGLETSPGFFYNMLLGPGTGLRLTADAQTDAWLSAAGDYSSANATVHARFSPRAADGSFQFSLATTKQDVLSVGLNASSPELALPFAGLVSVTNSRTLQVSYENLTGAGQVGRVRFDVTVDGASLAAVPEPGTAAMLLLGLVPLLAWRRGQRSAVAG